MMKRLCWLLCVLFCLTLLGCGGKDTQQDKPKSSAKEHVLTVAGTDVYRRTGPGTNYQPDGFYKAGERVTLLDKSNREWAQVENPDKTKTWIKYDYLAEYVYGQDKNVPEKIILLRSNLGDTAVNILESEVFPTTEVQLHKDRDSSSEIVGTLAAEKRYEVVDFEIHCTLGDEVSHEGKKVRLLAYLGEGYYAYYADGITRRADFGTNQTKVGSEPDEWVKVKTEKGEGWFSILKEGKNFHLSKSSGIWIAKGYTGPDLK